MQGGPPPLDIVVDRLRPDQVRVVYPLIRMADPAVSLRDWVRHAGKLARRPVLRRGVLVARRAAYPHPCAIVCYRLERRMDRSLRLSAEHLVIMELLRPEAVAAALIGAMGEIAAALGCHHVCVLLRRGDSHLAQLVRQAGCRQQDMTLTVLPVGHGPVPEGCAR